MSQQINLFDPALLPKKQHFNAAAMAPALAAIAGGLVVLHWIAMQQVQALQNLAARSTAETEEQRVRLVELGKQLSVQSGTKKLEDDVVVIEAQVRRRTDLLAEMKSSVGGNAVGFSRYLEALARQRVGGVWLTALEINPKSGELVVKGRSLSAEAIPQYVRALSREPVFVGRSVSGLQVTAREDTPRPGASEASGPTRFLEFTLAIPVADGEASRGGS